MDLKETGCYRDGLDGQISETAKEIDKNISYIIVGALGFFITMLDKFVDARSANLIAMLIISFVSLLIAFLLFLYCKHATIRYASKILKFVDNVMMRDPANNSHEQRLLRKWKKSNRNLSHIRAATYVFLGIGVVLEVLFFTINILHNNKKEGEKAQKVQIEIINKDSAIHSQIR